MKTLHVDRATLDDVPAVARIHVDAWRAAYRDFVSAEYLAGLSIEKLEASWTKIIETGESELLVARDNAAVCGWVSLGPCRDADATATHGEIWAIYVAPEHWAKGVGRVLWNSASSILREQAFTRCSLWVFVDNVRAQRFYRSIGFAPDGLPASEFELGGQKLSEVRYVCAIDAMTESGPGLDLTTAQATDGPALAELRVAAMRESLERVGRFDPVRAGERFLSGFSPQCTRHIELDGERVGFVVVKSEGTGLLLDHLYIHPAHQGRGVGSAVLARVFAEADAAGLPMRVGALRGSDSNRFYQRHGFVQVEQSEFDNYYVRPSSRLDSRVRMFAAILLVSASFVTAQVRESDTPAIAAPLDRPQIAWAFDHICVPYSTLAGQRVTRGDFVQAYLEVSRVHWDAAQDALRRNDEQQSMKSLAPILHGIVDAYWPGRVHRDSGGAIIGFGDCDELGNLQGMLREENLGRGPVGMARAQAIDIMSDVIRGWKDRKPFAYIEQILSAGAMKISAASAAEPLARK